MYDFAHSITIFFAQVGSFWPIQREPKILHFAVVLLMFTRLEISQLAERTFPFPSLPATSISEVEF